MEETSKKVRHTPGRWEVGTKFTVIGDGLQLTAIVFGRTKSEQRANTSLIASAPSLLEALEIAQQYVNVFLIRGEDPLVGNQIKDHSFKIVEAIKLAKGEIKTELI